MTWVSLQMISLGSLLIFNNHAFSSSSSSSSSAAAAASAARGSRCISEEELENRAEKLLRNCWAKVAVSPEDQRGDARTCEKAAEEMSGDESRRSVSPWAYRFDHDDSRFPHTIPVAECLCKGCIINGRLDYSFNSVPVSAPLKVLRKTRCPDDPTQYLVTKEYIKVPVACTCVVPNYTK